MPTHVLATTRELGMDLIVEVMVRGYHQWTASALPWSEAYQCLLFTWEWCSQLLHNYVFSQDWWSLIGV